MFLKLEPEDMAVCEEAIRGRAVLLSLFVLATPFGLKKNW